MGMVELTCVTCGKTYKRVSTRAHQSSYCSNECRDTRVTLICERCGGEYQRSARLAENSRFCSKSCKAPRTEHTCAHCGKTYQKLASYGPSTYCSKTCQSAATTEASKRSRVEKECGICGAPFFVVPSRAETSNYCSPECGNEAKSRYFSDRYYSSEVIECANCGEAFREYASHVNRYENNYCSQTCYMESKSSGLEEVVAEWLTAHGIDFQRQRFFSDSIMDFEVNGLFVEVNGCYWHGCPECYPEPTERQEWHRERDAVLLERAEAVGVQIITIWGHDIRADDFSVLHPLVSV